MSKKLTLLYCIIISVLLTSCEGQDKKPNPTVTPGTQTLSTEAASGALPSVTGNKFRSLDLSQLPGTAIPLTESPDSRTIYYMERTDKAEKTDNKKTIIKALKGDTCQKINLVKLDIPTGKKVMIAAGIPFISLSKWNKAGDMIAFCGGERLTVYDTVHNKLLLKENLEQDRVTYFGWSPDGSSIYTEHPSLINGTIHSFNDGKTLHSYETDVSLYYKGALGDNLYFASEALKIDEEELKKSGGSIDENITVITDSAGKVLKELPCGRFRDSYKKSMLQAGESGFGLYYFDNLDKTGFKELTREYVYDAKFIAGGHFIYTVKSGDAEKNIFLLCIADDKGNETAKIPVSGPNVSLSPDGNTGYINGPLKEIIDFPALLNNLDAEILKHETAVSNIYTAQNEEENLLMTLRGAMDAYLKFEITGKKDYAAADKYFIDSEEPPQMAHFDITTIFNERGNYFGDTDFYEISLSLSKLSLKKDRASVVVSGICRNFAGAASGVENALELFKKDGVWYVTGFSTFLDSKKAEDLKVKVEKIIKDAREGKLFEGKFKGADIKIGQIQFWQMSEPTLSSNIDYSNYCKVYLKVQEDGKEVIYKMVLSKDHSWAPELPTKERLSWLL